MPLLLALFFCSGACGLAYQVLWMRQLSYVFGVTAYAASTVLAAFMAGLALGSWLAGPLLKKVRRPLKAFGVAEIVIGVSAVATPVALDLASTIYRALYAAVPDAFALQTAARFVCAFVVLLLPTLLMGLTLPLLSASSLVRGPQASARIGALYAVNTAGAVTGTLLTGFIFIGTLGMRRTFLAAAVLNTLVGLAALALDRWLVTREEPTGPSTVPDSVESAVKGPALSLGSRVVWGVMAASGFGSLALEIVWFRMMTQYVEATTYAFSSMLALVLIGIATGGALASRVLTRKRDWHALLAFTQIATGALAVLGVHFVVRGATPILGGLSEDWRVMFAVLLPSLMMGFSFPLLVKLGVQESGLDDAVRGRRVGRFYGVNVLGAIAGSLFGGFVILPALGARFALVTLASVFVFAGLALFFTHERRSRLTFTVVPSVAFFLLLAFTMPDPLSIAAHVNQGDTASADEVFRDEGVQTTVSVLATKRQKTLVVGGLHQANDGAQMVRLHRQIGLLPMILHPNPAQALVIGLGGGATAGAVSQHDGAMLQVVELSDGVRKAAAFFSHVTYDVLNQRNVRVRVDDGRNFLLLSGERFDVITADIIQPIHAGAGNLYSREYFELVRRSLKPGGLVLQWIGRREKSHYLLIMRTFLDVFPDATLWLNGQFMIGSLEPLRLDRAAIEAKFGLPHARAAMLAVGLDSYDTLRGWYTAGPKEMAAFVGAGPLLTDDLPQVEYHRSLPRESETLDISRLKGDVRELELR